MEVMLITMNKENNANILTGFNTANKTTVEELRMACLPFQKTTFKDKGFENFFFMKICSRIVTLVILH